MSIYICFAQLAFSRYIILLQIKSWGRTCRIVLTYFDDVLNFNYCTLFFLFNIAPFFRYIFTLQSFLDTTYWCYIPFFYLTTNLPFFFYTFFYVWVLLDFLRSRHFLNLTNSLRLKMTILFLNWIWDNIWKLFTIFMIFHFAQFNKNLKKQFKISDESFKRISMSKTNLDKIP